MPNHNTITNLMVSDRVATICYIYNGFATGVSQTIVNTIVSTPWIRTIGSRNPQAHKHMRKPPPEHTCVATLSEPMKKTQRKQPQYTQHCRYLKTLQNPSQNNICIATTTTSSRQSDDLASGKWAAGGRQEGGRRAARGRQDCIHNNLPRQSDELMGIEFAHVGIIRIIQIL